MKFTFSLPGYRFEFKTATDIFSLDIYEKKWWGWKKVVSTWAFSGDAIKLLEWLNDWLEIYNSESKYKKGAKNERSTDQ